MINASYSKRTLIFKQPAGTSRGVLKQRDSYYLVLSEKENPSKKGIGEIAPIPGLSIDAVPELEEKIKNLVQRINNEEEIGENELVKFPALKFGYETALRSLNTRSPFLLNPSEFTNGAKGISTNGLIWMGSKEFMLQQIKEKLDAGFSCLKLKIGAIDLESEIGILQSIRKRYSSEELEIRVDANGAFPVDKASEILNRLALFNLHSIEQPIKPRQYKAMKKLCVESQLAVALDEELLGIEKRSEKEMLLDTVNPQYIILKPTLLGGIKVAEEWILLAKQRGIGWWVTSALESNVGLNAIAQWTATLHTTNFQGLGTGNLFTNNIESPLFISKGAIYYDPEKNWNIESIT